MPDPPLNMRVSQTVTWAGLSLALLANVGGILGIFGITGSLTLGYIICAAGVLILLLTLVVRYIFTLRAERKRLLDEAAQFTASEVQMSSILSFDSTKTYLKNAAIKEVHVLGSGTETYYIILSQFLNEGSIKGGITLHIGFRVGTNPLRYSKLKEYESKWKTLAQKYNLRILYYPYQDFFFSIRGVVFDGDLGFIGFYHRIKDDTLGVDEPVVIAKKDNPVSAYLIKNFLKVFDCLAAKESIAAALEGEEGKNAPLYQG